MVGSGSDSLELLESSSHRPVQSTRCSTSDSEEEFSSSFESECFCASARRAFM